MTSSHRLILASASPARYRLLQDAGLSAEKIVSGVDESVIVTTDPAVMAGSLAELKAHAVAAQITDAALVIGCDSVLGFDGAVLGKPNDAADATRRWRAMRGKAGVLHTGHCVVDTAAGEHLTEVSRTTVHFADVSDAEIEAYVSTGEPLHVAGAFTIDGRGGAFVERIEGDHGTVVGLSLPLLRTLLARLGHNITTLWR